MYYTEDNSNAKSFFECGGNNVNWLTKKLPADSDVQLPPNPALEMVANGVAKGNHEVSPISQNLGKNDYDNTRYGDQYSYYDANNNDEEPQFTAPDYNDYSDYYAVTNQRSRNRNRPSNYQNQYNSQVREGGSNYGHQGRVSGGGGGGGDGSQSGGVRGGGGRGGGGGGGRQAPPISRQKIVGKKHPPKMESQSHPQSNSANSSPPGGGPRNSHSNPANPQHGPGLQRVRPRPKQTGFVSKVPNSKSKYLATEPLVCYFLSFAGVP